MVQESESHLCHMHVTFNNEGNRMVETAIRSATELEK